MRRTFVHLAPLRSFGGLRRLAILAATYIAASSVAFGATQHGHRIPIHPRTGPYTLNFTLTGSCNTSAGIFGSDGHLVRTLWGNQPYAAGTYQKTWDGNDDFGNPVAADSFTAKLLTHNVYANWDGTIGNSSTYATGTTTFTGLGGVIDVLSTGNAVYLLRNYNEAGEKIDKFDRSTPGEFSPSGASNGDLTLGLPGAYFPSAFATDGARMYVIDTPIGLYTSNPNPMICAYSLDSTNSAWVFTGIAPIPGQGTGQNNGGRWLVMPTGTGGPNSLAVQKNGNLLAVSQVQLNQVDFFDKLTGVPVSGPMGALTVPTPLAVRWSPDEQTLWVASGTNVTGWQYVNGAWALATTIHGTSEVKSFAVNPADGSLAILYGGTDQQVRAYTPGGTWLYSIGSRGGYASGPAVNDTKFMIAPLAKWITGGVGFEDDGKLWILDDGNSRLLRFPVHKHLAYARKDAIVCMVNTHMLAVDPNNPTRMITEGYMEFQRDYSQPLSAGNGVAWKLVNNWGYGFNSWLGLANTKDGVIDMVTASNGHTYAMFWPAIYPWPHIVELTSKGVRDIAALSWWNQHLDKNMNIWIWDGNATTAWPRKSAFTGFDASNNPTWGPSTPYCTVPLAPGEPTYAGGFAIMGGMPVEPFPDGSIASFNTTVGPTDYNTYYLGFVKPGATDFWAKTAKGGVGTPLTHDGHMPLLLPCYNLIPDMGGRVCGDLVAIFANGEFFDQVEANQILLYHSSGLFVTDFGQRGGGSYPLAAPSGISGNFYGNAFVQCSDGNARILHSDESGHAGIHEWTLQNLASIQVAAAAFDASNTANFGVVHLVMKPVLQAPTTAPPMTDTFNRPDSATVGNGWTDPNSIFEIKGGRLRVAGAGDVDDYVAGALVRPDITTDSDQTVQVPAQYFDPTKMTDLHGQVVEGYWGVLSRYQTDGSRYIAGMRYIQNVGDTSTITGNGFFEIFIGMIINGQVRTLGFDHGFFLPPTPGHSYSLELSTSGTGPTYLHLTVTDSTTGQQYAVLDQVSDQPELQTPGQIGIEAAYGQNEFSSYADTLTAGAHSAATSGAPRQP
ncbi:MAG: hypothetical protein ACYC96_08945 [Fimbriimonadaceae bacterium]